MKAKDVFFPLITIMVIVLSSCAKLPVFESKSTESEQPVNSTLKIADNFNSKKNIHFGVLHDNSNLYLQVCFHKQDDLMKIMRGGLKIYFSQDGKKKKEDVLIIDKEERARPASQKLSAEDLMKMVENNQFNAEGMQGRGGVNPNFGEMICKELQKVTWKKGDKDFVFYRNVYADRILVNLESGNPSELILTLRMPLKEINAHTGDILAIGVETGTTSKQGPQSAGGSSQGGMSGGQGGRSGGGMGGGPGGGMGGGPGGGGMGGNMGAGGQGPGAGSRQSSVQTFNFWFQAKL